MRGIQDPISASKLLVDHALSRFSTDNLSCMVVRFDKDAILQSQKDKDVGVEPDNAPPRVSEVDKIVSDAKQKIADGSAEPVGISATNSGRGHDPIPIEEGEFTPTTLDGSVEEEPGAVLSTDSPEVTPNKEKLESETALQQAKADAQGRSKHVSPPLSAAPDQKPIP